MAFPPIPVYPLHLDSDRTLFLVYNTTETRLSSDNQAWAEEIDIDPAMSSETWANNGYGNIEGELFYYDAVDKDLSGKVIKLKRCARNIGGNQTKFNKAGVWVRSYVIAEHHNQLVATIIRLETFLKDIADRIDILANEPTCADDFNCANIDFAFDVAPAETCAGQVATYEININGTYTNARIDFGDGNTTTDLVGTHTYAPTAIIDPFVTVENEACTLVQTSPERNTTVPWDMPPPVVFSIPLCVIPELPDINIPFFSIPSTTLTFPQIILPSLCLTIPSIGFSIPSIIFTIPSVIAFSGCNLPSLISFTPVYIPSIISFTPINIPSVISVVGFPIPSIISFTPVTIPSLISFTPVNIPSVISIVGTIPSIISIQGCQIPSIISITPISFPSLISITPISFPSIISVTPMSLPSIISVVGYPMASVISIAGISVISADLVLCPISIISVVGCGMVSVISCVFPSISPISVMPLTGISVISVTPITGISTVSIAGSITGISTVSIAGSITGISTITIGRIEGISTITIQPITGISVISVKWGDTPTISVVWGACDCTIKVSCATAAASFAAIPAQPFETRMDTFEDNVTMTVKPQAHALGIPSEIKLTVPEFKEIKIQHNLPSLIEIVAPDIPHIIRMQGPDIPLPHEIRIINDSNLPDSIKLDVSDLPQAIKVDGSDIPTSILLRPINLPTKIEIDASDIPDKIQVTGIPSAIELIGQVPSEIFLKIPENLEVPLVYRGGPIPVHFDLGGLADPDGEGPPCFAITPCPKR